MTNKNYTIVDSPEKLQQLKDYINSLDFFAFDTETTGLNVRKDKVIGLSVCGQIGTAFYLPRLTWNKTLHCLVQVIADKDFYEIVHLLSRKELLMWNASFDIRVVKNNLGIDLTDSLLADIMLMKHTVEEEGEFGLKEVAIQYQNDIGLGGLETAANEEQLKLKENVLANGGSWVKGNKQMFKADLEIMGLYACADADLTLRLADLFRGKLEAEGLERFFYDEEVMPLYKLVTIPMEEHPVHLDLALMNETRAELVQDMDKLESSILAQLNAIPEVQEWKREKAQELYPPKNTGAFAQAVCEMYNVPLPKTAAGKYSLAAKEIQKLPESDAKLFLLGQFELNKMDVRDISWQLFVKAGQDVININSKPQMGEIVVDCLGIKPLSSTKTGRPQFDDDFIQHLADVEKLPWAKDLGNYNKLVKILGTYIDRFLEAQEDGKYYFSYKQHGTISGRYSGDAQQFPRPKEEGELDSVVLKYVNAVRAFFISAPNRIFIDCDYESLEPHVFSHVSGDEGLRDIFRKGHDFYSSVAIPTESIQNASADKKAPNYLGKLNKPARQNAKSYVLGIPYGMSAYALGMALGISTADAQKLVDSYLNSFPNLRAWMKDSERQVQINGFVKTQTGRIRHLPKVPPLYKRHGDKLKDWRYKRQLESKLGKDVVKFMVMDYKNGLNNAKNYQIQGLSASIVNRAAIAIAKEFKKRKINAWVCAQIHDQLIFDIPEDKKEECAVFIQDLMENTTKLSVDLKAPPSLAHNWRDGH